MYSKSLHWLANAGAIWKILTTFYIKHNFANITNKNRLFRNDSMLE